MTARIVILFPGNRAHGDPGFAPSLYPGDPRGRASCLKTADLQATPCGASWGRSLHLRPRLARRLSLAARSTAPGGNGCRAS